jgi:hypothetical protein
MVSLQFALRGEFRKTASRCRQAWLRIARPVVICIAIDVHVLRPSYLRPAPSTRLHVSGASL